MLNIRVKRSAPIGFPFFFDLFISRFDKMPFEQSQGDSNDFSPQEGRPNEDVIREEENETISSASNERSTSRSPRRFARFRQTRVASLSPTPTLIGFSRGTSRSPLRNGIDGYGGERQRSRSNQDRMGYRMRSKSRIRDASKDTKVLSDVHEIPSTKDGVKAETKNENDLEKGADNQRLNKSSQPSTQPTKKPLIARILPYPLPHFLGYRRPLSEVNPRHRDVKPHPSILPFIHKLPLALETIIWTMIGSFVGISIVELVFSRPNHFSSSIDLPAHSWQAPIIVGSFGASSVLLYATPSSPLGQPRSFVGGQFVSSVVGVIVAKLYELAGKPNFDLDLTNFSHSLVWLAGATATACALAMMMITGTLHPPGGATAVLCATNSQVQRMGWKIIPVVLLSSIMMLVWNLIWMNLGRRRYPEAWLAPAPATGKDGNLSQYGIEWLTRKYKARGTKEKETSSTSVNGTFLKPNPINIQKQNGNSSTQDSWQNESDWQESISQKLGLPNGSSNGQAPFIDQDSSEPVERPSRWSNSRPRGPTGI